MEHTQMLGAANVTELQTLFNICKKECIFSKFQWSMNKPGLNLWLSF